MNAHFMGFEGLGMKVVTEGVNKPKLRMPDHDLIEVSKSLFKN